MVELVKTRKPCWIKHDLKNKGQNNSLHVEKEFFNGMKKTAVKKIVILVKILSLCENFVSMSYEFEIFLFFKNKKNCICEFWICHLFYFIKTKIYYVLMAIVIIGINSVAKRILYMWKSFSTCGKIILQRRENPV